jgi:hypothetical protein
MSDGKKQGDEKWRDATPDDVFKVLKGETIRARVREEATQNWVSTDVDGYDLHITGWHRDKFIDSEGSHWSFCQVPVKSSPPSAIGLTYDVSTDMLGNVLKIEEIKTDASGKVQMSDGKKLGDEDWRDATAEDVAEIMKTGKPIPARVRNEDVDS